MTVRDVTDLYTAYGASRLPPGQRETEAFPVFTKGEPPAMPEEEWTISVSGAVESATTYDLDQLMELPTETQRQDVHCVTGWSSFDHEFTGVPFPELADAVTPKEDAEHVLFHAADGYTTDLPLADCLREEVLIAVEHGGNPLDHEHGGPIRLVTPHKYAYKGAKWLTEIEFATEPVRGYWEKRGYSVSANPWDEDRYE